MLKYGKYSYAMYRLHPPCWFISLQLCRFPGAWTGKPGFEALALRERFACRHPSLA